MLSSNATALLIIGTALLSFVTVTPNLVIWLLLAETIWIGFYTYLVISSAIVNSLALLVCGLIILCLATSESAIGLGLLIFNFMTTGNIHGTPIASTSATQKMHKL